MSQAPQDSEEETGKEDYLKAFEELAVMIRNGSSFSGRERNCAFSNRGDGTFADVSGLSGFGFPEDGRGLALTDWDHDGDVDVWVANRTGPRLRFLQNQIPSGRARWVSFRLVGDPTERVPRDAIGARVLLELKDGTVRAKSLHAGEGFVSQSSKWIHFGLGDPAEITSVKVHWAHGDYEEFSGVVTGQRWYLHQGQGQAVPERQRDEVSIDGNPLEGLPETGVARMAWSLPLKIPRLVYQDFSGNDHEVGELAKNEIVLVNLWATWCEPCAEELKLLEASAARLAEQGVKVLALNVDHLGEEESQASDPARVLASHGFSGVSGVASPELLELLDGAIAKSFFNHQGIPVPTSFLIDRGGWLSVAYKGQVDPEVLFEDVGLLGKGPEVSRKAAMPYDGNWGDRAFASNPVKNAMSYLEGHYFEDAREVLKEFLEKHGSPPAQARDSKTHAKNMQQAEVYFLLGEADRLEGEVAAAISRYETSLKYNSKQVMVLNQLAWLLSTNPDPAIRDGARAVAYAEFMMKAPKVAESPGLLSTAAAAYAAAGDFSKAIGITRRAIALLKKEGDSKALNEQNRRLELYGGNEALTE